MAKVLVYALARNESNYIRQCIESVLSQSLREFWLVIIDNGSTDSTIDIMEEYAKQDARIVIKRNSKKPLWPL
ncbi:glycosyltransferase [Lachnospiraceae bacterium ZAX-1]